MYTISHVAQVLGVPAATLRAWQRRYGVVTPTRTASGYRLYDEADVSTLRTMQGLIDDGWSPRQAADAARSVNHRADTRAEPVEGETETSQTPSGRMVASPLREGDLVAAAAALDGLAVARMVEQWLAYGSFERMVDDWLLPQLERLGNAWAAGEVSIAGEHLVASALQRRLSALYDLTGPAVRRSTVVTGLPAGCRHELGILCFAIACRRLGVDVAHVGPDLPEDDWLIAIETHHARAAVLAVPTLRDVQPATRLVLRLVERKVLVGVGGHCQHEVRGSCDQDVAGRVEWLGHRIGPAAAQLAARLAEPNPTAEDPE